MASGSPPVLSRLRVWGVRCAARRRRSLDKSRLLGQLKAHTGQASHLAGARLCSAFALPVRVEAA
eukprot:13593578-Alexandrium_andersonii.AAC.1